MKNCKNILSLAAMALFPFIAQAEPPHAPQALAIYYKQDGRSYPGLDPILGWTKSDDAKTLGWETATAKNYGIARFVDAAPAGAIVVTVNRKDRKNTPDQFQAELRKANGKAAAAGVDVCIDGWNGYAEGKWIICDFNNAGELWMRAVSAVFGRKPAGRLVALGSKWSTDKFAEMRAPDFETIPYGPHWKQRLDLWLPPNHGKAPLPVLLYCHGGGWTSGTMEEPVTKPLVERCDAAGVALVSMQYRYLQEADAEGIKPRVKASLEDCVSVLKFLAKNAAKWNLDLTRAGMTGGSAGGASSLWAALSPECPLLLGVVADCPQTSFDPKQMREWLPNLTYGPYAFGCRNFNEFLARREELMPEILLYSPAQLVPIAKRAGRAPKIWVVNCAQKKAEYSEFESIHSPVFCAKFKEICDGNKIECVFVDNGSKRNALEELLSLLRAGAGR